VIGGNVKSPLLDTFLETEGNNEKVIDDLDPDLKKFLFTNPSFKPAVSQYIEIFSIMGFLSPVDEEEWSKTQSNSAYYLHHKVPIYDFTSDPPILLREVSMNSDCAVSDYWTAAEVRCIATITSRGKAVKANSNEATQHVDHAHLPRLVVPSKYFMFFHPRNW
jgi:hypothetical protein